MNTIHSIGAACTGCSSCVHSCPLHCIVMKENKEGFLYPQINRSSCIHCGVCLRHCPAAADLSASGRMRHARTPESVWAFQSGDREALRHCASGGAADAAAAAVLEMGGTVYGAALVPVPEDKGALAVRHIEVTDTAGRGLLRSSKYVQSDLTDTFSRIRRRLAAGETVLFTGTPCQNAGLYSFLGHDHPGLYTLDLICHGVPSPGLFREYLAYRSKWSGSPIRSVEFRSKEHGGWGTQYLMELRTDTRTFFRPAPLDKYGFCFLSGNCYRESCYRCPYACIRRISDLTAGDFWGVWKSCPELDSPLGLSSVFINTPKGRKLFEHMSAGAQTVRRISVKDALAGQGNLQSPTPRPADRDTFLTDLGRDDYFKKLSTGLQPAAYIRSLLPRSFYTLLKRIRRPGAVKGE